MPVVDSDYPDQLKPIRIRSNVHGYEGYLDVTHYGSSTELRTADAAEDNSWWVKLNQEEIVALIENLSNGLSRVKKLEAMSLIAKKMDE